MDCCVAVVISQVRGLGAAAGQRRSTASQRYLLNPVKAERQQCVADSIKRSHALHESASGASVSLPCPRSNNHLQLHMNIVLKAGNVYLGLRWGHHGMCMYRPRTSSWQDAAVTMTVMFSIQNKNISQRGHTWPCLTVIVIVIVIVVAKKSGSHEANKPGGHAATKPRSPESRRPEV